MNNCNHCYRKAYRVSIESSQGRNGVYHNSTPLYSKNQIHASNATTMPLTIKCHVLYLENRPVFLKEKYIRDCPCQTCLVFVQCKTICERRADYGHMVLSTPRF